MLIGLSYWRTRSGFLRHAFATNARRDERCGFLLVGYQLVRLLPGGIHDDRRSDPDTKLASASPSPPARRCSVAGLMLVMFVLPAEYAVDPLGTGARSGCWSWAKPGSRLRRWNARGPTTATAQAGGDRRRAGAAFDAGDGGLQDRAARLGWNTNTASRRARRCVLVDGPAPVEYEFHAEPDGAPRGYAQSYEKATAGSRRPGH